MQNSFGAGSQNALRRNFRRRARPVPHFSARGPRILYAFFVPGGAPDSALTIPV